jgi:hypothetical protein
MLWKDADPGIPKIGAATPYDFQGSNMTAYGGLLPVATMLQKLQFQQLIEEHVTIKRFTTSMPGFRFVLAMILTLYVGFSRLNHLQFLQREPMLTGILEVNELPVQSTFWRFLASLHLVVAGNCWRWAGACGSGSGKRPTWACKKSLWTQTPRYKRYTAGRWARAKGTTRSIGGRRAFKPS